MIGWVHVRSGTWLAVAVAVALAGCSGRAGPVGPTMPPESPVAFAVPNPYALPDARQPTDVRVERTVVFGDSYSRQYRNDIPGWPALLERKGVTRSVAVYARGGATTAGLRPSDLAGQVARFRAERGRFGPGDLVILYIGYNDIDGASDLAPSEAAYARLADELLELGAGSGGRRLFVTLLHDWSRNPGADRGLRGRVLAWNGFVLTYAACRGGIVAVDLFTPFEQILADPRGYGFTNVTDPDPGRAGSTALFVDPLHVGERGNGLIAEVYRYHLTWGWDWANSVGTAAAASGSDPRRSAGGRACRRDLGTGSLVAMGRFG
jgi:hypothetical protein